MRWSSVVGLLTLPDLSLAAYTSLQKRRAAPGQHVDFSYSIFNAVHHAMRQFGSSLDHNGMTMFFATVPADIELYHGTSTSVPIAGMEWLAFEPEHALVFTHPRRSNPPGHGSGPGKPPPWRKPLVSTPPHGEEQQHPLAAFGKSPSDMSEENEMGYLHTYRTKHELRLLYVDGQSAAKSTRGTLDIQDFVLRNSTSPSTNNDPENRQSGPPLGGPMNEKARAIDLCNLAANEWHGKIDGILRMEAGFEIILCSFTDHLQFLGANAVVGTKDHGARDTADSFNYYHAVAARYDGIGGGRVAVDFDNMVSLFTYPSAIKIDVNGRPRVVLKGDEATAAVAKVRRDLTSVLTETGNTYKSFNWQSTTDMVVSRYADRIGYLASGEIKTITAVKAEIERALRPFIDYTNRSSSLEIERCTNQLFQATPATSSIAAKAITTVLRDICSTFSDTHLLTSFDDALSNLRKLKGRLAWTTWKRCRGCGFQEFCLVPIWPMGREEEFERPRCSNGSDMGGGEYWRGH